MLRRIGADIKTVEHQMVRSRAEDRLDIIVNSTARDPLDQATQPHVIPAGTPMAPVSALNGHFMPIRRTTLATAMAATTVADVVDATPFGTGDVVQWFTTTNIWEILAEGTAATLAGVDYANNQLTFGHAVTTAALGAYVEVNTNGHLVCLDNPVDYDAVILLRTVQNQTDPPSATTICVPAEGAFGGSMRAADVNGPSAAGVDDLLEYAFRNFTFIAAEHGA